MLKIKTYSLHARTNYFHLSTLDTYFQTGTQDECRVCPLGHFNGLDSCEVCLAGSYAANTGQPTCTPCEAGTEQPSKQATSCTPCTPGKFATAPGAKTCNSIIWSFCLCGTAVLLYLENESFSTIGIVDLFALKNGGAVFDYQWPEKMNLIYIDIF